MRLLPALACSCLLLTQAARAEDVVTCVDTVAELEAALQLATVDLPTVSRRLIRLEQGSYNLTNASFMRTSAQATGYPLAEPVVLAGGYTNNCAGRVLNPANTLLTNTGARRMDFEVFRDLLVSGLTFADFANRIEFSNFNLSDTAQRIELANNRFREGSGGLVLGVEAGNATSELVLRNNQLWARGGDGNCVVRLSGDSGPGTTVRLVASNNTIAGAGTSGDGVCLSDIELPEFHNNVFYLNPGDDLVGLGNNGLVTARHNLFQSNAGLAFLINSNNSAANPLFLNALAGDLRLDASSPGVNSGFNAVPGGLGTVDVAGQPRLVGANVDRGAHESAVSGTVDLTVTTTADSGAGSLRDAITQANASPGFNRIRFNIPGSGCPKIITVTSALPAITDTVHIDGGTQPGFVPNTADIAYNGTMCILVRGPDSTSAFRVSSTAPADTRLTVDSLAFGGFFQAVQLFGGASHRIFGNHFGTDLAGNNAMAGGVSVASAASVQIGGSDPGERNVFANLSAAGDFPVGAINVGEDSTGVVIVNNYFGTEPNGVTDAPIEHAIVSAADDGRISRNLMNNATEWALILSPTAERNTVDQNRLGLPVFCIGSCTSTQANVRGFLIEGTFNDLWLNRVAFSLTNGVRVTGNDNRLYRVEVFGMGLGAPPIDIGVAGFNGQLVNAVPNPTAGNRSLNWPIITGITPQGDGDVLVTGTLASANGVYHIDIYSSPRRVDLATAPRCEGEIFAGNLVQPITISNATPGVNGTVIWTADVPLDQLPHPFVTAVARRQTTLNGDTVWGDTSEYGNCLEVPLLRDGFEATN
jgi:hypothetical protein